MNSINKNQFLLNFFNTKSVICLMNKRLPATDVMQKIISFTDGKFNFKKFNKFLVYNIFDAIENNDIQWVDEIIQKDKSKINAKDDHDNTPLHRAAIQGRTEIVQWLLFFGANYNEQNKLGETPLDCAQQKGHTEIAQLLMIKKREQEEAWQIMFYDTDTDDEY